MSAFIVSPTHINVIVSWFMPNITNSLYMANPTIHVPRIVIGGELKLLSVCAPEVARILYEQNVRSVNTLYDKKFTSKGYSFTYIPEAHRLYSIGEIAGAIDCLEYQSCETEDYEQTDAYKILTTFRKILLEMIQDREAEERTWEITKVKETAWEIAR